ncbi:MAG TPA: glycosyl hydrolase [Acidimicrobiales bacterium]|nr:glycosyl hydrolase [Acidimicrobiales bacterium]
MALVCLAALLGACGGSGSPPRTEAVGPSTTAAPSGCTSPAGARLAPAGGGAYFGVNLDWDHDSTAGLSGRLGHSPALYVAFAPFPLDQTAGGFVDGIVSGLAGQHQALMLTLEPNGGLDAVTDESAADLAGRLAGYNRQGVPVFLRFAHEMNGSWYPWGQSPERYVAAFRTVAAAVHRAAPATATVWAPSYGGGYPFAGGRYQAAAGTPAFAALDTNHDGVLTMADDAYAPYYPGDDAVDWVGMSLYHWGAHYPWGDNTVPEPGKFAAMLTGEYHGTVGDETAVPDFYGTWAGDHHKPVAITETAAFFAPGRPGDEAAIKQGWWSQVFDASTFTRFPKLAMVNWFEWDKYEAEVKAPVSWAVTRRPELATAFAAALPAQLRWAGAVPDCK